MFTLEIAIYFAISTILQQIIHIHFNLSLFIYKSCLTPFVVSEANKNNFFVSTGDISFQYKIVSLEVTQTLIEFKCILKLN